MPQMLLGKLLKQCLIKPAILSVSSFRGTQSRKHLAKLHCTLVASRTLFMFSPEADCDEPTGKACCSFRPSEYFAFLEMTTLIKKIQVHQYRDCRLQGCHVAHARLQVGSLLSDSCLHCAGGDWCLAPVHRRLDQIQVDAILILRRSGKIIVRTTACLRVGVLLLMSALDLLSGSAAMLMMHHSNLLSFDICSD